MTWLSSFHTLSRSLSNTLILTCLFTLDCISRSGFRCDYIVNKNASRFPSQWRSHPIHALCTLCCVAIDPSGEITRRIDRDWEYPRIVNTVERSRVDGRMNGRMREREVTRGWLSAIEQSPCLSHILLLLSLIHSRRNRGSCMADSLLSPLSLFSSLFSASLSIHISHSLCPLDIPSSSQNPRTFIRLSLMPFPPYTTHLYLFPRTLSIICVYRIKSFLAVVRWTVHLEARVWQRWIDGRGRVHLSRLRLSYAGGVDGSVAVKMVES